MSASKFWNNEQLMLNFKQTVCLNVTMNCCQFQRRQCKRTIANN